MPQRGGGAEGLRWRPGAPAVASALARRRQQQLRPGGPPRQVMAAVRERHRCTGQWVVGRRLATGEPYIRHAASDVRRCVRSIPRDEHVLQPVLCCLLSSGAGAWGRGTVSNCPPARSGQPALAQPEPRGAAVIAPSAEVAVCATPHPPPSSGTRLLRGTQHSNQPQLQRASRRAQHDQ
jgi:hypothetical protein